MKHLTLFQTHQDYEDFESAGTLVKPNVSRCINEEEVHYSPFVGIIAEYEVTNANNKTRIMGSSDIANDYSDIIIDDIIQETKEYQVSLSVGKHIVKYVLNDPNQISDAAFNSCSNLTRIKLPDSLTEIKYRMFDYCSQLNNITLGNNVTKINMLAFRSCRSITNIGPVGSGADLEIPNNVTKIGTQAFSGCKGLISINIPNGVTKIEYGGFEECTSITSVTIPDSVESMGQRVFYKCSGINYIICNATIAPVIQNDTFLNVKTNGTLTVPSGSSGYDVWMNTGNYYLGLYNWTKIEQ